MSNFSLTARRLDYLVPSSVKPNARRRDHQPNSNPFAEDPNDFYLAAFDSTPTFEARPSDSKDTISKSSRIVPPPRSSSYGAKPNVDVFGPREGSGPRLHDVRPLEIRKRKITYTVAYHGVSKPKVVAKVPKPFPSPRSPRARHQLFAPLSPSPLGGQSSRHLVPGPTDSLPRIEVLASNGSDEEYVTEPEVATDGEGPLVTPEGNIIRRDVKGYFDASYFDAPLSPPPSLPHSHSLPFVPIARQFSHTSGAPSMQSRTSTTRSSSDLHLGLGKFHPYDERAAPGPSPPSSPSPTRRTYLLDTETGRISEVRTVTSSAGLPAAEAKWEKNESPMTPSRAGAKAMQMLGSSKPVEMRSKGMMARVKGGGGKRKHSEHFRPLPSSVLKDIDLLFGKAPSSTKTAAPRPIRQAGRFRSAVSSTAAGLGDRKVGQGNTVEIVDENGTVWQDLEEQQEFAWLLSEQGRGGDRYKVVSPVLISRSGGFQDVEPPAGGWDDSVIVITTDGSEGAGDDDDDDNPFGMSNFASVLTLPRPRKAPFVIGSSVKGSAPLAFLSTDPYARTLEAAQMGGEPKAVNSGKRRPAPLKLVQGPPSHTSKIVAVQADSGGPTLGYVPPPRLDRRAASASTSKVTAPSTPYVTPRTAPLPPHAVDNKGTDHQTSKIHAHHRLLPSPEIFPAAARSDVRKGQSFFDSEISPDARQQTFSIDGVRRKASGAFTTMLKRVNA